MTDDELVPLSLLNPGTRGRIARIHRDLTGRAERLAALGVTTGASVHLLQTFPGIVFECDQTEMAVERRVAAAIWIEVGVAPSTEHPAPSTQHPAPSTQHCY